MSTKTSIKRIAAVAAVALTLGGFSAVSANAAMIADSFTAAGGAATAASSTTVGTAATTAVIYSGIAGGANDTATISGSVTSSPITSSAVAVTFAATTGATQVNVASLSSGVITATAAGRTTQYATASFSPDKAGTYVIKLASSGAVNNQSVTWTITVTAPTLGKSTAFIGTTVDGTPITADATTLSSTTITASGTPVAAITVKQYSSTDTTTAMDTSGTVEYKVAVSGVGLVGLNIGGTDRSTSTTVAAGGVATQQFYLFPSGTTGTSTITISLGGTVVATKTFLFYSTTVAAITTTLAQAYVAAAAVTGFAATTPTITAVATDKTGSAIPSGAGLSAKSSDTTIATVSATGTWNATNKNYEFTVTGVKAGTATITVSDTSTGLITSTQVVNVTTAVAATAVLALDAASYSAGDKVTWTLTAKDSTGSPVADGTYTAFFAAAAASNQSVPGGTLPAADVTFKGGVATGYFYAPSSSFTVSAKVGTASTTATALQATTVSASATVTNAAADAAQAAVDAANEATDAANAATDAANNAMDSADAAQQAALDAGDKADAALAAVTDLASKVADIATQISALSSLVSKIAASVAKISAKVKA